MIVTPLLTTYNKGLEPNWLSNHQIIGLISDINILLIVQLLLVKKLTNSVLTLCQILTSGMASEWIVKSANRLFLSTFVVNRDILTKF